MSPVKLVVECELWIGWYLKSVLAGELFTVSRNWLTGEGQSLQGQPGPKRQSIRIQKIKDVVNTREN